MLCNDHNIGLTNWYARPTPCGTVNNGVDLPIRLRYDNMNRSSTKPNVQSHVGVTTSIVKAFQQPALLSNTLMSIPVFLRQKNLLDP